MSGVKGRSGRRRNPKNALIYFNEKFDENIYDLTDKVLEIAKNGDREMLIYCFDRRLGRPKASTEIDITGGEQLGAGTVKMIMIATQEYQKKLREGQHAITESSQEGLSERLHEEEEV